MYCANSKTVYNRVILSAVIMIRGGLGYIPVKLSNIILVKELQSKKDYLLSEQNISNKLSNKMIAVTPETLIINMDIEQ